MNVEYKTNESKRLVSVKEMARILALSSSGIYKLLQREGPNAIPRYRINSAWRFDPDEVLTWAKSNGSYLSDKT